MRKNKENNMDEEERLLIKEIKECGKKVKSDKQMIFMDRIMIIMCFAYGVFAVVETILGKSMAKEYGLGGSNYLHMLFSIGLTGLAHWDYIYMNDCLFDDEKKLDLKKYHLSKIRKNGYE